MAEVFSEKVAPLLSLLGCQKPCIWTTSVVWSLLVKPIFLKSTKTSEGFSRKCDLPNGKKHRKSSISQILHLWDPTSLEKAASNPSLGKFPLMWLAGDFKTFHSKK